MTVPLKLDIVFHSAYGGLSLAHGLFCTSQAFHVTHIYDKVMKYLSNNVSIIFELFAPFIMDRETKGQPYWNVIS